MKPLVAVFPYLNFFYHHAIVIISSTLIALFSEPAESLILMFLRKH